MAFPAVFSGKTREVYLKGEGFFEVHKDSCHPFIVKTDFVDVKVLGTTFNISAYEDESVASTVLVEGSVNVSQKNKILGNQSFVLSPGEGCFYSVNDEKSDIRNIDVNFYTSWKDGIYQFKNMPLLELVRKVKKYYNIPIQIEGQELSATRLSGKLVISDEINEVMQYIAKTLEGRFEKNKDGIYIIKN
jgi:ferric-dicitrate binding protein FerR (iron transport regulator)